MRPQRLSKRFCWTGCNAQSNGCANAAHLGYGGIGPDRICPWRPENTGIWAICSRSVNGPRARRIVRRRGERLAINNKSRIEKASKMQFIKNGPDVPERLLQRHEDGEVVFFCGAGISFPAGLPSFGKLVAKIFANLNTAPNNVQAAAINGGQYDTAVGLLESDYTGGRIAVRRQIENILSQYASSRKAIATHQALLTLARGRDGSTRIVTTNFDRLFERVIADWADKPPTHCAPFLPVPKRSRWDGVVYLHGLLPEVPTDSDLQRLVVSSGDFGLAYLTERWAARFTAELFRSFTVCFVGYSLDDPVLRYMMDALAADKERGESPREMFAFGAYDRQKIEKAESEWNAKNVTPILYRSGKRHSYLHRTLKEWAARFRDGTRGKEQIVLSEASGDPRNATADDDFVKRILWAITDHTGLPAKKFAEHDPVPSLNWLKPITDPRYGQSDLPHFKVEPGAAEDDDLEFSVAHRPAPYRLASWMALTSHDWHGSRWDEVMFQLARWLRRHLDDPTLPLWIAARGGGINRRLAHVIQGRIDEVERIERNGDEARLQELKAGAPRAVPRPMLRTVWRILLNDELRSESRDKDFYEWLKRWESQGLTASLRISLRQILQPCVEFRKPLSISEAEDGSREAKSLKELIDWNVKLNLEFPRTRFKEVRSTEAWQRDLPLMLRELTALLRDALDLMRELGGASDVSDLSYIDQPSIRSHRQNRGHKSWTLLVELVRDSWCAASNMHPIEARHEAESWLSIKYPLFKRMAFFAATNDEIVPADIGADWLLRDDGWWLWSIETQREALRLLVRIARDASQSTKRELESAILCGPAREMFKEDIDQDDWESIRDRGVWLRLEKMVEAGADLGGKANQERERIARKYPGWSLADDGSDEFPFWMGEGDEFRTFVATPRERRELVEWLEKNPDSSIWQEDDWQQRCREEFPRTACALYVLSLDGKWPVGRWEEALNAWSSGNLVCLSWRWLGPTIADTPNDVWPRFANAVSWWLRESGSVIEQRVDLFLFLCRRVLEVDYKETDDEGDVVTRAINHPVGHVTEALLNWWSQRTLRDEDGLPEELEPIITDICQRDGSAFRYGRLLLAGRIIALFRVDPTWTREYLIPRFEWRRSTEEALAVWKGFLNAPRLYRPLLEEINSEFIEASAYYRELGDHGRQYATFLTLAALERGDTFKPQDLKDATERLPEQGKVDAVRALVRSLESAGDKKAEHWHNRIVPYLEQVWPKSRKYRTASVSEALVELSIAADEEFPEALDAIWDWLLEIDNPDMILMRMLDRDIPSTYPQYSLFLIDKIVADGSLLLERDLRAVLEAIGQAEPALTVDERFLRLADLLRRREG